MFYVYVIQSQKDKSLYIGYTVNLRKRVERHNNGLSLATRPKRPYMLLFYEGFVNKMDAKHREEYLKSGFGLRSLKKMLKHTLRL